MSSTSQPTTFSDLYTDLLNRVRESTSQSSRVTQAKRYINSANQDIALGWGEKLPWLERRHRLILQPKYDTGTVSVTKGSTSVTGSGTAWDTANDFGNDNVRSHATPAFGKLRISGQQEVYLVNTVPSDTSLTLVENYLGETDSGLSYVYYEDEFVLPGDFLKPVDARNFSDSITLPLISRTEFRRRFLQNSVPGTPRVATIYETITKNAITAPTTGIGGSRLLAVHPPPSDPVLVHYTYVTTQMAENSLSIELTEMSSDNDQPLMPLRYRHLLVLGALKNWYRDQKDDTRSREVAAEYGDAVRRMVADVDIGAAPHAVLRPRQGGYWNRARRPYSSTGRGGRPRYDLNGEFDRLEDL